jgi:hypothetical protein
MVEGFHAKDGSHNGSGGKATFADGAAYLPRALKQAAGKEETGLCGK